MVGPEAVILAVGSAFTTTVLAAEATLVQPVAFVTRTLEERAVLTVILWVVAPSLHTNLLARLAVRVTLPTAQKVVGPEAVIVAVGSGFTVTVVAVEVALQPLALVTVTL